MKSHYPAPRVRFVVRVRVMCQAGRCQRDDCAARRDVVAWLCECAPLWIVVYVCALPRFHEADPEYGDYDNEDKNEDDPMTPMTLIRFGSE
jgi:hypothetical protein